MENTVTDLHYEIKFENCERQNNCFLSETLLFFLEQKYILFSEKYFFKIPKNLITSAFFNFFFAETDTKKHKYASIKASNTALVKLTD